eukprot:2566730-Prorocentrum_lima.AAC.1
MIAALGRCPSMRTDSRVGPDAWLPGCMAAWLPGFLCFAHVQRDATEGCGSFNMLSLIHI